MPRSSPNALSPPAAAITRDDSAGVITPHIKHDVYFSSNAPFNSELNRLFSLMAMTGQSIRPIDRALARAKELGMNQVEFAAAMDTLPQHVTNWKRRGMPPEHHARAAKVLHWTIEQLLGLTTQGRLPAESAIGHQAKAETMSDAELDRALLDLPRELKISLLNTVRRARQPSPPPTVQPLQTDIPGATERRGRRRMRTGTKRDAR